jgi:hydroxymethylpyrimidine pyrophosphatase-like HAD family hydrolase
MTRRFAEHLGIAPKDLTERAVFVGDSPNDAPMFGFFPHACGVANVADFGDLVDPQPAYITQGRAAAGFTELAAHLLTARMRRFGRIFPRAARQTRKDIHDGR